MSVPDFPSRVQVWLFADDDNPTYVGDIDCRVVPCVYVGNKPVSAAAITGQTHWVDMAPGNNIPVGYTIVFYPLTNSIGRSFDASRAAVLVWCDDFGAPTYLVALHQETRYAGTPDEYVRVWCAKTEERNHLNIGNPC